MKGRRQEEGSTSAFELAVHHFSKEPLSQLEREDPATGYIALAPYLLSHLLKLRQAASLAGREGVEVEDGVQIFHLLTVHVQIWPRRYRLNSVRANLTFDFLFILFFYNGSHQKGLILLL